MEKQNEEQLIEPIDADNLTIGEGEPAAEEVQAEAKPQEAKVKIGGKEFASQAEAWAYAERLEQENLANDAYKQGIQDALNQSQQAQSVTQSVPEEDDSIFDELYTNPKEFLAKRDAQIAQSLEEKIFSKIAQENREKELWNQFYSENPDLKSKDKLVKLTLQENWDTLGYMKDAGEAMKILAQKTRGELRKYLEDMKPQHELSNFGGGPSPGSQQSVTQKKTEEKPLGFLDQIAKMQDKRVNS